ncbi:hypothetical protein, partial [Acinetobacter pittii]|uniref:hypothetical protein n=1 Tax=Acinetobacter pittii TaxID=48296 RepID=UPI0013D43A10
MYLRIDSDGRGISRSQAALIGATFVELLWRLAEHPDEAADFAFLAMDLEDRGLKCHARRFVSLYLEHTGDYQALELLNFY